MIHVFRNYTVEPIFKSFKEISFSGYEETENFSAESTTFLWFYACQINGDIDSKILKIRSFTVKLRSLLKKIPENTNFYAFTIVELDVFIKLNGDFSLKTAINEYNNTLIELSNYYPNLRVIDFSTFTNKFSLDEIFSWKYYYLTESYINPKLESYFHNWLNKKIYAIKNNRKKCLIIDMDNTIWGGVLGEDGVSGIKLGGGFPGNAFKEFQEQILYAKDTGVILAACSKNNENDVINLITNHPYQVLKKEDFSVMKINWNNKVQNIKEISEELNIGTDSMVFIDDNPVEREFVKNEFPEIITPNFPKTAYELNPFFNSIFNKYFQLHEMTKEDKNKTSQYIDNSKRLQLKSENISINQYLKLLKTEITIYDCNSYNISRISQMTKKTNQFNLTTKRYDVNEIKKVIANEYLVYCGSVKDKFGNNGITAAAFIKMNKKSKSAEIDSFLLSCRILGREIENCFLKIILNLLIKQTIYTVKSKFIKTEKNSQVESFYENNGFKLIESDNLSKEYLIHLSSPIEIENYFKINYHD